MVFFAPPVEPCYGFCKSSISHKVRIDNFLLFRKKIYLRHRKSGNTVIHFHQYGKAPLFRLSHVIHEAHNVPVFHKTKYLPENAVRQTKQVLCVCKINGSVPCHNCFIIRSQFFQVVLCRYFSCA